MKKTLFVIFLSFVFIGYFTPMELGDIWWHLKTGEWILEHMSLPDSDPFSVTAPPDVGGALSSFYLCQIFLHLVHKIAGIYGLIALKALLFCLTFLIALWTMRRFGVGEPLAYLLLLPVVFLGAHYDEIRPQTFSFLFFAITLYLLEKQREAGHPPPYPLLFLMPLWANIHPGFVSGAVLTALYGFWTLGGVLSSKKKMPTAFSINILSIALSGLNPNGFAPFSWTLGMFRGSVEGSAPIHEHLPLREFAAMTGETGLYALVIALAVAGILSFVIYCASPLVKKTGGLRRPDILHLLLFVSLSYAAFSTFRAGMFFGIFFLAATGKNLSAVPELKPRLAPYFRAIAAISLIIVSAIVFVPRSSMTRPAVNDRLIPVKAAAYLLREGPGGGVFNPYEWGGYFIWRLYPKYKVFADGRALGSMEEYDAVLGGRANWDDILKNRGVNTAVYWPILPYEGRVPRIIFELLKSEGWSPVYWDLTAIAFVRAEFAKSPINKGAVWELITSLIGANISAFPGDRIKTARGYAALGEIYMERGMRNEAETAFREALRLDPKQRDRR